MCKYQKIYNQIIERAKGRILSGYIEKHHIIPTCIGGINSSTNIISLTAREHFICHMLLCEIYPDSNKLKQSLFLMSRYKKYKISSRVYERLKSEFRHTEETKGKMRKPKPDGVGEKIRNAKLGVKQPNISKAKLGGTTSKKGTFDGPKHTDLGKKSISNHNKGNKEIAKKISLANSKPVLQIDMNGIIINEFESYTLSKFITGIDPQHCLLGKSKHAGGFLWKYKNNK
jgi:hypothetical protein